MAASPENLAPYPSFEFDALNATPGGWASSGTAPTTFAVQSGWAFAGSKSLRMTTTLAASGVTNAVQSFGGRMLVTGGLQYAVGFRLNVLALPANGGDFQAYLNFNDASNSFLSNVTLPGSFVTATGVTAVGGAVTAPALAASVTIQISAEAGTLGAGTYDCYIDAMQANRGSTLTPYADGGSPGWVWLGTAGASTSRLAPPGVDVMQAVQRAAVR